MKLGSDVRVNNTVGLDWDAIGIEECRKRASDIERQEKATVILYKTMHGFHALIIMPYEITAEENIQIRRKYGDDERRIAVGIKRYNTTRRIQDLDVLFAKKNGYMRRPIL